MEQTDTPKEWFVTHEGKQFGPVSFEDLRFEMDRGELNPRLDMVWKNGMEDWIPAGEVPGLFQKNTEASAIVETSNNFTPYAPGDTEDERERIKGNWPGVGRGTYFFVCFIFPVILGLGIGTFRVAMRGRIEPTMLELISNGLLLLFLVILILVTLKRFQNLAMSRWWYIPLNIPPLMFWVQYRLFACPPGYAKHKNLDGLGWFLAILYWLLILLLTAAFAAIVYVAMADPNDFKGTRYEKPVQELMKFMEEARDRGEKLRTTRDSGEPSADPATTE